MKTDTIAAIATALSDSGIGIIRVSGEESIKYTVIKSMRIFFMIINLIPFIMVLLWKKMEACWMR